MFRWRLHSGITRTAIVSYLRASACSAYPSAPPSALAVGAANQERPWRGPGSDVTRPHGVYRSHGKILPHNILPWLAHSRASEDSSLSYAVIQTVLFLCDHRSSPAPSKKLKTGDHPPFRPHFLYVAPTFSHGSEVTGCCCCCCCCILDKPGQTSARAARARSSANKISARCFLFLFFPLPYPVRTASVLFFYSYVGKQCVCARACFAAPPRSSIDPVLYNARPVHLQASVGRQDPEISSSLPPRVRPSGPVASCSDTCSAPRSRRKTAWFPCKLDLLLFLFF